MKKRLLSVMLVLSMLMTMVPTAFAAEGDAEPVAQVGETQYATLAEAFAAVKNGETEETTITLLDDINNETFIDVRGKKTSIPLTVVFDLDGHTLTMGPAGGSQGTKSNGFRIMNGSEATVMNGTVLVPFAENNPVKVGFANYGTLHLENVTVEHTGDLTGNTGDLVAYTINNGGELSIVNSTITNEVEGATDGCYVLTYGDYYTKSWGANQSDITVDSDSELNGIINVGAVEAESTSTMTFAGTLNGSINYANVAEGEKSAELIITEDAVINYSVGSDVAEEDAEASIPEDVVVEEDVKTELVETIIETKVEDEVGAVAEAVEVVKNDEAVIAAAATKLGIAPENVVIQVVPAVEVKVVSGTDVGTKTLVLDITPVAKVTAVESGNETHNADLGTTELEVTAPVTVTIPVPETFAQDDELVTVVHIKDNGEKIYHHGLKVENGEISFLNEHGFSAFVITPSVNLNTLVSEAYKAVYEALQASGAIDTAQDYLDEALKAVEFAYTEIDGITAPELADAKAAVLEQLGLLDTAIGQLDALLGAQNADVEEILALIETIGNYVVAIEAQAPVFEQLGKDALAQLYIASEYVADLAETMAQDAYDWAVDSAEDFVAAYEGFVADVVDAIADIDADLADAVEAYLTETPAAALEIMYTYGEDAVEAFIPYAMGFAQDVETVISGLSVILDNYNGVVDAIIADEDVQAVVAEIAEITALIEGLEKTLAEGADPVTALEYAEELADLKTDLVDLQNKLIAAVIAAAAVVDPFVADSIDKAMDALYTIVEKAEGVAEAYGPVFVELFDEMAGELLVLIVEKTEALGAIAGPIVDELIRDFLGDVQDEVIEDLGQAGDAVLEAVGMDEIKALIADLKAEIANMKAQVEALKNYTGNGVDGMIDALVAEIAEAEAYVEKLETLAAKVEALVQDFDVAPEATIEKVTEIVEIAESIITDTENLVKDTQAALASLVSVYEAVLPQIIAAIESAEGPVGDAIDVTEAELNALLAELAAGYETTLAAVTEAAGAIEGIVNETVGVVSGVVAEAVADIADATKVAVDSIYGDVTEAIAVIEEQVAALANSTDAKARAAAAEIQALIDALNLTYSEAAYKAAYAEVEGIVNGLIAGADAIVDVASAEAFYAEVKTALEQLYTIGEGLYVTAEADVKGAYPDVVALAEAIKGIVENYAGLIGEDAFAAYEVSAQAIMTAAGNIVAAVETAVGVYEVTIGEAASAIIAAVNEAAVAIGEEVTAAVEKTAEAVEAVVAQAESSVGEIASAWAGVLEDATSGEYDVYCDSYYVALGTSDAYAKELAKLLDPKNEYLKQGDDVTKADLVTIGIDTTPYTSYIMEQVPGLIAYAVKTGASEYLKGILELDMAKAELVKAGLDLDATADEIVWAEEYPEVDEAVLTAVLDEVKSTLEQNGVAEYALDMAGLSKELAVIVGQNDATVTIPVDDLVAAAVEYCVAAYLDYAAELAELYAMAPEGAQVVLTGTNSPLADIEKIFGETLIGQEVGKFVAEYTGYVLGALDILPLGYALLNDNTTFVADASAEAVYEALGGEEIEVIGHVDENEDGYCDRCGEKLSEDKPDPKPDDDKHSSGGGSMFMFPDVPPSHPFYKEIMWAYYKDLLKGYEDGYYRPANNVTRQHVWMVLARMSGEDPADMAEARAWAMANGVSDGTNPGAAITRQQMVAMFYRYATLKGYDVTAEADITVFPDHGNVADYAKDPLEWAIAEGIIKGYLDGTLQAPGLTNRGQFAAVLYRFFKAVK